MTDDFHCRVWISGKPHNLTHEEWLGLDINFFKDLHRPDGPACEFVNGDRCWYLNGKIHRVGGPAAEYHTGREEWFEHGKLHRMDGPAIIWSNDWMWQWWVNGKELDKEEVENWIVENNIDLKTEEGQIAFKLMWA